MGTPREDLADKLKEARVNAGFGSQGALARKLNVSRSLITKAEIATHPVPSEPLIIAWASITGVPVEPLLELPSGPNRASPSGSCPTG
jgi:transcriptional regulator with XRE-family HTH domain